MRLAALGRRRLQRVGDVRLHSPELGAVKELAGTPFPIRGESEKAAYERVLTDAIEGDPTHFARQDYVEEAWRIVDPVLKAGAPVHDYAHGTWGPAEALQKLSPPGGWHDPNVSA